VWPLLQKSWRRAQWQTVPKSDEAMGLFQTRCEDHQSTGVDVRRRRRCGISQRPLPAAMESLVDSTPHDLHPATLSSFSQSSTLYSPRSVNIREVESLDAQCCDTNCYPTYLVLCDMPHVLNACLYVTFSILFQKWITLMKLTVNHVSW
jgi:hypothetical protein